MFVKNTIDLMNFSVFIDDIHIIPIEIKFDETDCEVTFSVVNSRNVIRKVVRGGKHDNYVFKTSIFKTPFTINLLTNVIKKDRKIDV